MKVVLNKTAIPLIKHAIEVHRKAILAAADASFKQAQALGVKQSIFRDTDDSEAANDKREMEKMVEILSNPFVEYILVESESNIYSSMENAKRSKDWREVNTS